jgi:serine/threonine-protein kinase RsbW
VNAPSQALEVSNHGTVELKIPGRAEWVAVARLAVAAVASRLRFSVDEIEDIKLAIAEACTNSIQGSGGSDAGVIEIVCDLRENELRVTVRDHAPGHKLEPVIAKAGGIEDGRTEELGVFLIRALMDSVDYTSDPRRGTELVMSKHVSA